MLIRRHLRGFVVRKEVKAELRDKREETRVIELMGVIRRASQTDQERMHQAAARIQRTIYTRIRQRREGRELRAELSKLPPVVWAGYLRMKDLKANTAALAMDMKGTFRR